jgi:hypothetical protein
LRATRGELRHRRRLALKVPIEPPTLEDARLFEY